MYGTVAYYNETLATSLIKQTYVWTHTNLHMHGHVYMHVCVCTYTTYKHTHTCTKADTQHTHNTHTSTCTHACMHRQTDTRTHVHTHTHLIVPSEPAQNTNCGLRAMECAAPICKYSTIIIHTHLYHICYSTLHSIKLSSRLSLLKRQRKPLLVIQ